MEVEEDWLTEVASRMMEHKSITVIKESRRMGEEVIEINTNIYQEFEYMEWLKTELFHLRIDAKTIANPDRLDALEGIEHDDNELFKRHSRGY